MNTVQIRIPFIFVVLFGAWIAAATPVCAAASPAESFCERQEQQIRKPRHANPEDYAASPETWVMAGYAGLCLASGIGIWYIGAYRRRDRYRRHESEDQQERKLFCARESRHCL